MSDFVTAMLDLLIWPFSQSDSFLFMTVFGVFLFCFSFSLIKYIMRLFL